jgi:hypothetical protein
VRLPDESGSVTVKTESLIKFDVAVQILMFLLHGPDDNPAVYHWTNNVIQNLGRAIDTYASRIVRRCRDFKPVFIEM